MCRECGCGFPDHGHRHDRDHAHHHDHDRDQPHGEPRTVEVGRRVLARNDAEAEKNRRFLADRNIVTLNLISAPGAGKTALLEATLERLAGRVRCAVIAGDQQTDNDARRLAGRNAPVVQIETGNACHLNAGQVGERIAEVAGDIRLLFIENVGNLVCPVAFDLGESFKVGILSVTEGEDKPLKYPTLFVLAPVVVVTKKDLVPHLDWDRRTCLDNIAAVRSDAKVFELSAKTGEGMDGWIDWLEGLTGPVR